MKFRNIKLVMKILLITAFFSLGYGIFAQSDILAGEMSMTSVYVSRGDAIIIESKGQYMLVDSGTSDNAESLISHLDSLGISKIDYVVATHPDGDHVGGFTRVLEKYEIGEIFYSPCTKALTSYYDFIVAMKAEGCPYSTPSTNQTWTVGDAKVTVLYDGTQGSTFNESSLVLRVTCDDKSILLTGDLPSTIERELMKQGVDFKCDVLKVGHHGAAASSCASFLDAANPSYAVISSSKSDKTVLPKPSVLRRLARRFVKVYRTTDGNVKINFKDGVISTSSKINNPYESIKYAKITLSKNVYTENGKKKKPKVTLSLNGIVINPSQYTVKYSNNTYTGVAKVKVSGNETKYVSSCSTTFKILPKSEKLSSLKLSKYNNVKLEWSLQSRSSGYIIQYSTDKKFKKGVKTIICSSSKKASKKLKNLKYNKKYYFRVRAYTNNAGYGKWSTKLSLKTDQKPLPKAVELNKLKYISGTKFEASWKRQKKSSGYILQYSTDKSFKKNVKTITLKKNSITSKKISGLKKHKKYYVRIRGYKKGFGNGKWSKKKSYKTH